MDSKLGHFSLCSFECFLIIRISDIECRAVFTNTPHSLIELSGKESKKKECLVECF